MQKAVRYHIMTQSKRLTVIKDVNPIKVIPKKYRSVIREKAINRARSRIIVAGSDPRTISVEDLEIVVREEEDKIKGSIREKGLLAVLALLGLNFFG